MKESYQIIFLVFICSVCFLNFTCTNSVKNEAQSTPVSVESFVLGKEYYQSPNAPIAPQSFRNITAALLVSEIKAGWNLGNTFDAHPGGETSWGNPITTCENFAALKKAGFNAVRIPVSWVKACDKEYNISRDWMDRVTQVVNYAAENDMYIILNSHHDEEAFKFTSSERDKSLTAFYRIWSQIAYNFRNYSEKLIFEGLNEPRTKGSANEWSGGTFSEYAVINEHYRLFVNIVRAQGGNNAKRIIIVNPYAASAEQSAMNGLAIPEDTAENKIIVSIHAYSPYEFALKQDSPFKTAWSENNSSDINSVRTPFDRAYNTFVSKGFPVIMGEFGAVDRNNNDSRIAWIEYFASYARSKGIPCFIWDNGLFAGSGEIFGFFDRRTNTFPNPEYLEAFMRGAGIR